MTEDDLSFLPLKVRRVGPTGKQTFDPHGKRRLIEACRRPGVSISGMALKAGVNANQLRKWVRDECERDQGAIGAAVNVDPAFVPVVTLSEVASPVEAAVELAAVARREAAAASALRAPAPARLRAQLPNGVTLELECGRRDGALLKAMVEALGTS